MNDAEDFWLNCIREWYPKLHEKTYFLPPLHFNRVRYGVDIVVGETVLVPQSPEDRDTKKSLKSRSAQSLPNVMRSFKKTSIRPNTYSIWPHREENINPPLVNDSDVREDIALRRVLHCLHALADNSQPPEVMMVVSQLQFGKYLNNPTYQAAVAFSPHIKNMKSSIIEPHLRRGDFDVLIIHKHLGLIILEIKSVGANFSQLKYVEVEEDSIILKKVKEAIDQLNKAEKVLSLLVSDLEPVKVTKCLVMPNIESEQLLRVVKTNPDIEQGFCHCLRARSSEDAIKQCLLSDQMSGKSKPWDERVLLRDIFLWWNTLQEASGSQSSMTDSQYEVLVSRFCGPATTVEVYCVTAPRLQIKTEWEGVSETGERMARLILLPEEVELLNRSPRRVFLTGPPGTGKTVLLILQGLNWLQRGFDVHVVSTWSASRAVSFVIEHQLQRTMGTWSSDIIKSRPSVRYHECDIIKSRSSVHYHEYEKHLERIEVIKCLMKSTDNRNPVCVIADEAGPPNRKKFSKFCDALISEIQDVCLWAAAVDREMKPESLEMVKLTKPLRSPPTVIREIKKAFEIEKNEVCKYSEQNDLAATDGPAVIWSKHRPGWLNHTENTPHDCVECGKQIARILRRELFVGVECIGLQNGPPPLHYRDVLVMCDVLPVEDRMINANRMPEAIIGLVQGLHISHVPVRLVERDDEDAIRDVALGSSDVVSVAHWDDVRGLEKKVVIVEYMHKSSEADKYFRLHHMSRCSSQLVVIDYSPEDVVQSVNSFSLNEAISEV